jgi:hypothetical protein
MWPSEMKELPPETSTEPRQQVVRNQSQLRAMNFKFTVALYVVILGLLTIVLHTGFNPMLRPLVVLLWVVGGVSLFLRSQVTADRPRPFDSLEQIRGALPERRKKLYDLKDLPPELAANPEVRKLFEWAEAQGASLTISPRDQFAGRESQNPETVKVGVAANSDVQKLSVFVESHGPLPTDLQAMEKLGAPLSAKLISSLSRIVTWASLIVIFAALAVAAVALWSPDGVPHRH